MKIFQKSIMRDKKRALEPHSCSGGFHIKFVLFANQNKLNLSSGPANI
jgi:hypothetical protein